MGFDTPFFQIIFFMLFEHNDTVMPNDGFLLHLQWDQLWAFGSWFVICFSTTATTATIISSSLSLSLSPTTTTHLDRCYNESN